VIPFEKRLNKAVLSPRQDPRFSGGQTAHRITLQQRFSRIPKCPAQGRRPVGYRESRGHINLMIYANPMIAALAVSLVGLRLIQTQRIVRPLAVGTVPGMLRPRTFQTKFPPE
jgi:hypothetical protein